MGHWGHIQVGILWVLRPPDFSQAPSLGGVRDQRDGMKAGVQRTTRRRDSPLKGGSTSENYGGITPPAGRDVLPQPRPSQGPVGAEQCCPAAVLRCAC